MCPDVKVLVAGDFHIPYRASEIPEELIDFLNRSEIDLVVITGDLVRDYVLEPFRKWPIKVVRGNMDEGKAAKYPEKIILELPNISYKTLIFHGTGIYPRGDPNKLRKIALKNKCKVILTGHTHTPEAKVIKDVVIINPGSGTGVYGGGGGFGLPSWAYVIFRENSVHVKIYGAKSSKTILLAQSDFIL